MNSLMLIFFYQITPRANDWRKLDAIQVQGHLSASHLLIWVFVREERAATLCKGAHDMTDWSQFARRSCDVFTLSRKFVITSTD